MTSAIEDKRDREGQVPSWRSRRASAIKNGCGNPQTAGLRSILSGGRFFYLASLSPIVNCRSPYNFFTTSAAKGVNECSNFSSSDFWVICHHRTVLLHGNRPPFNCGVCGMAPFLISI